MAGPMDRYESMYKYFCYYYPELPLSVQQKLQEAVFEVLGAIDWEVLRPTSHPTEVAVEKPLEPAPSKIERPTCWRKAWRR